MIRMPKTATLNEALGELDRLEADYEADLKLLDGIHTKILLTRMAHEETRRELAAVQRQPTQQQAELPMQLQRFLQ